MNILPPLSPFAQPFAKAVGLEITYQGQLRIATFRVDEAGEWQTVEFNSCDLADDAGVECVLGTASNAERGLLVVSPDTWEKPWPGAKAIILGESPPYPHGNLNYPGGYDPNKFAVPVHLCSLSPSRDGVREWKMSGASYQADGGLMECGSLIVHVLDRKLPVLVASLWLEAGQRGRVSFPQWPAGGALEIAI